MRIRVINIHICSNYDYLLRCILLKRLEQLEDDRVVLLGNLFISNRKCNTGKQLFLSLITMKGYNKILGMRVKDVSPYYTHALQLENIDDVKSRRITTMIKVLFICHGTPVLL